MLTKLLKWELRATWKKFTAVYAVFALLCIALPALLFAANHTAGAVYSIIILSLGFSALLIAVFIFVLLRYNAGLYGDEGPLTFALPAKSGTLLLSRVLTAFLWNLLAYALALASFATVFVILEAEPNFQSLADEMLWLYHFGPDSYACIAAMVLVGALGGSIPLFFSITVAHLSLWGKGGTAMGFVAFIAIYLVETVPYLLFTASKGFFSFLGTRGETPRTPDVGALYTWQGAWPSFAICIVSSLLLFWATAALLKRRLSLR